MMDAGEQTPEAVPDPRTVTILDIVAKETGVERTRLQPEAKIEELGISSLDMTQTVFELESRFDIEIPVVAESAGAEFATVGDLLRHVLKTLDEAGKTAAALASGAA
jgi:acyl carrier protein